MRRTAVALACLTCALGAAAPAMAQKTVAPPGASAIDEYLETVPGAGGNTIVGKGAPTGRVLGASERRALERLGKDGASAAAAADATGPSRSKAAAAKTAAGKATGAPKTFSADSAQPPLSDTLTRALGGSGGGLGAALPILLVLSVLVAAFFGLRRRRAA